MVFLPENDANDLLWWDLMSDYPDLGEGLEELGHDPEAGVVAAIGIFTILKLRFWHRLPGSLSENSLETHRTDDDPPPQAAIPSDHGS